MRGKREIALTNRPWGRGTIGKKKGEHTTFRFGVTPLIDCPCRTLVRKSANSHSQEGLLRGPEKETRYTAFRQSDKHLFFEGERKKQGKRKVVEFLGEGGTASLVLNLSTVRSPSAATPVYAVSQKGKEKEKIQEKRGGRPQKLSMKRVVADIFHTPHAGVQGTWTLLIGLRTSL